MSARLYNWNSRVLPDSKYIFYFTLFQNSVNVHKSILTVSNGQMKTNYVTSPLWSSGLKDTSAIPTVNSTETTISKILSSSQE